MDIQQTLDIKLPDTFKNYSEENKALVIEYVTQLSPIEKRAYSIAQDHLGSSFHILKSNGFCDWLKQKTKK
jgi:hypothetical protein